MQGTREKEGWDRWLLIVTLLLLGLGAIAVLDASSARALQSRAIGQDPFYYFKKQVLWTVVACGALFVGMRFPYGRLRDWKCWVVWPLTAAFLLALVLIIGREINGSKRWLTFGPASFQPSEFAKVALVLFLARYSELWRGRITHFTKGFLPPVAMVVLLGVLVAKEDLGTAITLIGTGLVLIFMMGARAQHMGMLLGGALLAGIGFILVEPYRWQRVEAWLSLVFRPLDYHVGAAYQPAQGLIALGSGGFGGAGIGKGTAKHLYLPAEHTDYIFATIGEEIGLWGTLLLVACFAVLVVRGLTVAHRTRDWFGSLVAAGLTCMIGFQAVLNIAVVTSLVPCTGVPLPFISYGGSSLVFTALAVGIILNISQYPGNPSPGPSPEGRREPARPEGPARPGRDRRAWT